MFVALHFGDVLEFVHDIKNQKNESKAMESDGTNEKSELFHKLT